MEPLPAQPHPIVTVVIPTCNRVSVLLKCLEALAQQTWPQSKRDVIVVDDGSTDDTFERLRPFIQRGELRYHRLSSGGPARARNVGIGLALGELIVFIGDDIICTPTFLEEHVGEHRRLGSDSWAVVGFTDWATSIEVTPLMRYENLGQFDYHHIGAGVDPHDLPHQYFYTSNVSVSRAFLLRHRLAFDEDFRHAMGEDGELAYRMCQHGLKISYNARAVAFHEHPTTFGSTCRRYRLNGAVAILQAKKHPELADLSFLMLTPKRRLLRFGRHVRARLLAPALWLADRWRLDIHRWRLAGCFDVVFQTWKFDGMLDGLKIYGVDPSVKKQANTSPTRAGLR